MLAVDGIDNALFGHRVNSTIGQGCPHHGEVPGGHIEGALAGINICRFQGIEEDANRRPARILAMPRLRWLVAASDW